MTVEIRRRRQIFLDMAAKTVVNSELTDLHPGSNIRQTLDSAGVGIEDNYYQLASLKECWDISTASGDDLDDRLPQYNPLVIERGEEKKATGTVIFSCTTPPAADVDIQIGTFVVKQATSTESEVAFETTELGTIPAGSTASAAVQIRCTDYGTTGNVASGTITGFKSNPPAGVEFVTNTSETAYGADAESDVSARAKIQRTVNSAARGVYLAIVNEALSTTVTATGQQCLLASTFPRMDEPSVVDLYIDDGIGQAEATTTVTSRSPETIIASYSSETYARLDYWPVKEGTQTLKYNSVAKIEGVDYLFDCTSGRIKFLTFPGAGHPVTGEYTYYTGLIAEVQRRIDGVENDRENYPGVKALGDKIVVQSPAIYSQSVTGAIEVTEGIEKSDVQDAVKLAIEQYIDNLDIGENIIYAEIIAAAMNVDNVINFSLSSPTTDVTISEFQLARSGTVTIS